LIQNRRQELIEYLGIKSLHYNNSINAKKSHLELIYKVSNLTKERLRDQQSIDIQAKTTLIGPHRDDMEVLLDGFTISSFGSRGQQRSALLALKLSEIDFLMSKTHEKPVLLLDDIFSELDENHREAVLKTIDGQQTVITSAEKLNFLDKPFQIDL
jgi:DNA replication and repair protein RecF